MSTLRARVADFNLQGFIAAASAIANPDQQEIDWVAFAPEFEEEVSVQVAEFMPLGFLMAGVVNDECRFSGDAIRAWLSLQDEFRHIFVPFTAYPRQTSRSPLEVEWPYDGYVDVACADGSTWSFLEQVELASRSDPPWPWMFCASPCQLGYRLRIDGETLDIVPAVLVTELEDEGSGPFVVSFYFLELEDDRLGTLRNRLWSHVERFLGRP